MKQRIYQYIREHHMIEAGDCVCVGCSGGADSICLLTVLSMLCREGKISCTLMACHLNHMLRGEESDADEAFVREYCAKLEIPLVVERKDVAGLAADMRGRKNHAADLCERNASPASAEPGVEPGSAMPTSSWRDSFASGEHPAGLEAAGRAARERLYERCLREYGVSKIALAHHIDDQAETVIFHMARGAGMQGMAGIRPVSGSKIRPLLCVRRGEIESWLRDQGIAWCDDASNASDDYARNRIRHRILPVLESEINAGSTRHIAEAAETIQLADQWIREETERYFAKWVTTDDREVRIDRNVVSSPEFVQRMLIMRALTAMARSRFDLGLQHVHQVQDLLAGVAGRRQDLPHGITAVRTYEGVSLRKKQRGNANPDTGEMQHSVQRAVLWNAPGEQMKESGKRMKEPGVRAEADLMIRKKDCPAGGYLWADIAGVRFAGEFTEEIPDPIPEKTYTKWLNCDKITGSIVIRTRRPGDYILLDDAGRRQSIKAWMINRKIPREERDRVLLVVHEDPAAQQGAEVLWIVGGRIGASARVDAGTRRVLKLTAAIKENVSG